MEAGPDGGRCVFPGGSPGALQMAATKVTGEQERPRHPGVRSTDREGGRVEAGQVKPQETESLTCIQLGLPPG